MAAARANADRWAGGSAAPDLLLEVELVRYPFSPQDQCLALALNTQEAESKMSRKLQSLAHLNKGVKQWNEWFDEVEKVYKRMRDTLREEGDSELACFLSRRERRELEEMRGGGGGFAPSRELELLTVEFWAYSAMHRVVTREHNRGQGESTVKIMGRVFRDIQDARIRFADVRNLALWKSAQILKKFVDNGCMRVGDMYEEGLLGVGGVTLTQVKEAAGEAVQRALVKRAGGVGGGEGGGGHLRGSGARSTGDGKGGIPELPLLREVEKYPNGEPILNRAGQAWKWHTCKACADAGRWPGHHPKQCDHSYPEWRTNPPA